MEIGKARAAVPEVVTRRFQPDDAEPIRSICHRTGFMGEPVEWMWKDRQSFTAFFCDWWLQNEPESVLVAELDGVVSGYLLGCEDSRRVTHETRTFFRQLALRGCGVRPGTAAVMWRMLGDGLVDGIRGRLPERVWDQRWPAHLHINLLPTLRRQGAGRRLVSEWLGRLRDHEVPGCHLQTTAENTRAVAFFEAMGFEKHGPPTSEPGFRTPAGERLHIQLMVQTLG